MEAEPSNASEPLLGGSKGGPASDAAKKKHQQQIIVGASVLGVIVAYMAYKSSAANSAATSAAAGTTTSPLTATTDPYSLDGSSIGAAGATGATGAAGGSSPRVIAWLKTLAARDTALAKTDKTLEKQLAALKAHKKSTKPAKPKAKAVDGTPAKKAATQQGTVSHQAVTHKATKKAS